MGGATALGALAPADPAAGRPRLYRPKPPLVLGHRGACALRPEHTLASYAKAIADGADFIEPDLDATRDGAACGASRRTSPTPPTSPDRREFAHRRAKKKIDGKEVEGWFTEDFSFAELKTLRAKERLGAALRPESHSYDGDYQIPEPSRDRRLSCGRDRHGRGPVGLIPELKHSTYFASIGLPLEERFLNALRPPRKTLGKIHIIAQSFEIGNLRRLRSLVGGDPNFQLMQLTESEEIPADRAAAGDIQRWDERLKSQEGLAEIAEYADWIAPYARDLIPRGPDDRLMSSAGLIERAA